MNDITTKHIDAKIKQKEKAVKSMCSPYNGHCYEVALALTKVFTEEVEGYWSVYTKPEFVHSDKALPSHITVQINGDIFDAGGTMTQSHLLEEFAPTLNEDVLQYQTEFKYNHITSNEITSRLIEIYRKAFE